MGGLGGLGVFLCRNGSPSLAANAAVVERPHFHLHERDGKLVTLPVVPVNPLQERRGHVRYRGGVGWTDMTHTVYQARVRSVS